jgi:5'-nucleotidase
MQRLVRLGVAALVALLALPAVASAHRRHRPPTVQAQILAINDFHGNLEPETPGTIRINSTDAAGVPAGGAAYLAADLRAARRGHRNSLTVSAGDLIGASPLTSALFHDEPTIEAFNRIGLDLNAVGNHEFDEGRTELERMQYGGCHPVDGCYDGTDPDEEPDGFAGARFRFLAANVVDESTGRPIFRPYVIRNLGGVRVGFIGLTLKGTPDIVSAAGVQGLRFLDEADTINRYATELRWRRGVSAIVVLLHQGGAQSGAYNINSCVGFGGDILDILNRTTLDVDLFITGHTHQPYNCVINDRPVTSASSFGRLYTDIEATLSRRTRDFTRIVAENRVVYQTNPDGTPARQAPDIAALVAHYATLAAPLANQVIGVLAGPATKDTDDSGENAAGNLIADSQQASAAAAGTGSVAAFMNPGGVRGTTGFPAGPVTYTQAFTIQPFGNTLVTITLTGAQLLDVLKEQWCGQTSPRILLPSAEVHYTYSAAAAAALVGQPCAGAPSPVTGLTIGGVAVDPAASYRITVNNFLAGGGDAFATLAQGTDRTGGALDLDALVAYLAPSAQPAAPPQAVPALNRIDVVP